MPPLPCPAALKSLFAGAALLMVAITLPAWQVVQLTVLGSVQTGTRSAPLLLTPSEPWQLSQAV